MRSKGTLRALYLCYYPLTEPLVETQVLPYLRALATAGHTIHLMSYEVAKQNRASRARIRAQLSSDGIVWHRLRYHKRPSIPATAFDVVAGILAGAWIVRRNRIQLLHARTHVPGAIALAIARFSGCGLLFDIRGLMAEEYVDAGTWRKGSLPFRVVKLVERHAIKAADGVVVLTERAKSLLFDGRATTDEGAAVMVIPSCVDTALVAGQQERRNEIRERLHLGDGPVIAYVGKFATWYMAREMANFFAVVVRSEPKARFLVLTQSDRNLITKELDSLEVPPNGYHVTTVAPGEVGAFLAAADCGVSFIKAAPSKIASSPTKVGEYLAAGLPIVVGAGVGDTDELLRKHRVGVVVEGHSQDDYERAWEELQALLADEATRARCIDAADEHLSLERVGIPRYRAIYEKIAHRLAENRRA